MIGKVAPAGRAFSPDAILVVRRSSCLPLQIGRYLVRGAIKLAL